VASVPAALWLCKQLRARGAVVVVVLVAYVAWPSFDHRHGPAQDAAHQEVLGAETVAAAQRFVGNGYVVVVPDDWPLADSRYFSQVQPYWDDLPPYRYRYLPDTAAVTEFAPAHGLALRYFAGPQAASITAPGQRLDLTVGSFRATPVGPKRGRGRIPVVRLR
jgi:hypothetical protein